MLHFEKRGRVDGVVLVVSLGGLSSNRVDVAVDWEEGRKVDDIGQDIRGEETPRHKI